MAKVKLLVPMMYARVDREAGAELIVDEPDARALVRRGQAERVDETAPAAPPETATAPAAETATAGTPRRRGKAAAAARE